MPTTDDFGRPIDTSVVNLARAIRTHESGSNYNAKGKTGEHGAFQWMPGNFEAAAKKYKLNPSDFSPVNQDKVAYYTLLEDKNKGLTPEQIAAKWNSGSPTGWESKRGTNSKGVAYDVPAYVSSVMREFQAQKLAAQGNGVPPKSQGGFSPAPVADAGEIDSFPQQSEQQYDETELMLMKAAGMNPNQPEGPDKPYTLGDIFKDFSIGFAKKELTTAKNLSNLFTPKNVLNIFSPILGSIVPQGSAVDFASERSPGVKKLFSDENLKTEGPVQTAGGIAENVGEFIAAGPVIKTGQLGIKALITGSGLLPAAGRVLGQAGLEAAGAGGVSYFQTGDAKEAAKNAALFGGLKTVTGAVGEIGRALKLPERIYSSIFKNTYKDVVQELKTAGAKNFQKNFPEEFKALSNAGAIKVGKNGVIDINETIAKQALDRGLKGSLKTMANTTVAGLYRAEGAVRSAAKKSKGVVDVSEKQFQTVLREIAADYKDVGFGQFASKAKELANAIKTGKGKLSAENALAVRRLLDGLRSQASFDAPVSKLSLGQKNLAFLANTLRARVNKIPGMAKAMEDYAFHIEALEHIGKAAKAAGNKQIISLLDAVFFGGGAVSAQPAIGAGLGLARRVLSTPKFATEIAQTMQNGGTVTKTGQMIKGLITSLRPFQEDQQSQE